MSTAGGGGGGGDGASEGTTDTGAQPTLSQTMWSYPGPDSFKLRSRNYLRDKKKVLLDAKFPDVQIWWSYTWMPPDSFRLRGRNYLRDNMKVGNAFIAKSAARSGVCIMSFPAVAARCLPWRATTSPASKP